jgi:hypothetical protein
MMCCLDGIPLPARLTASDSARCEFANPIELPRDSCLILARAEELYSHDQGKAEARQEVNGGKLSPFHLIPRCAESL